MAGARESLCFGGPKSTFRIGGVLLRNAVFVAFVTGAVNRDFWTCGSFADFVAGAALCDPRRADFVAGAALCEPRNANFVAGAALNLEVQISWPAQHLVNLKVQISWQVQHLVNLDV